jgi:hypothetical protein
MLRSVEGNKANRASGSASRPGFSNPNPRCCPLHNRTERLVFVHFQFDFLTLAVGASPLLGTREQAARIVRIAENSDDD